MKLILRADVRDLGRSGELVEVKDGYGRNYLLPRKMAVPATEGNMRDFRKKMAVAKAREERERAAANTLADRLRGQRVVIIHRVAEGTTRLHGSVTTTEIGQAISRLAGQEIDRRDIDLRQPIRSTGDYQVNLKIMRGLSVPIKVLVTDREPVEEAPAVEAPADAPAVEAVTEEAAVAEAE